MRALVVAALVFVLSFAAACARHLPCRDGTLLVAVTLAGGQGFADELEIEILVEGQAPKVSTVAATLLPSGRGNLEVVFPSGYPTGALVTVTITAKKAGVDQGVGGVGVRLSGACAAAALTITGFGLGSADLRGPPDDLWTPDLTTQFDLFVPAGVENCFNQIDDDADGMADCEDPDCDALAVCVPALPSGFTHGTTVSTAMACPAWFGGAGETIIGSGVEGGGACAGCTDACSASGSCEMQIDLEHQCSDYPTCALCEPYTTVAVGVACAELYTTSQTADFKFNLNTVARVPVSQTCTPATEFGTKPTASFGNTLRFCPALAIGSGCGAQVCVPRATATTQCGLATSVISHDTTDYPSSSTWFTGLDDQRQCVCACNKTDASCETTYLELFTAPNCSSGQSTVFGCSHDRQTSARMNFTDGTKVKPTCTPTVIEQGTLAGSGDRTLACRQ